MAHTLFRRLRCAVQNTAHNALDAGLTLLFPPACVGCGRIGELFCAHCAQAVEESPARQFTRHNHPATLYTYAAALHTSPLREAIHAFKYENQPELAPLLARYLVATFARPPWSNLGSNRGPGFAAPITAVAPVPLHAQRLAARGYNQAELLAQHFCRAVGLPLQPEWLTRIRETRQQVGLGPRERQNNVDQAFVASPDVAGSCLLLIDDVYTTGATLRACAVAARAAGACAVYGLTLAQPVRQAHLPAPGDMYEDADIPDVPWWEGEV